MHIKKINVPLEYQTLVCVYVELKLIRNLQPMHFALTTHIQSVSQSNIWFSLIIHSS